MIESPGALAAAVSQSAEITLVVKITIAAAIGLTLAVAARRTRASIRHVVLAATLAVILALPGAAALLPSISVVTAARPAVPASAGMPSTIADRPFVPNLERAETERSSADVRLPAAMLRPLWLMGALPVLGWLGVQLWRLRRLRATGIPWLDGRALVATLAMQAGIRRPIAVLLHESVPAPLTCGMVRPAVLLPADAADWTEPALRRALVHELEHVRRHDWALHLAARVACAVYWFHPLVWAIARRLALEAERACDDAVIAREESTDYAEQLVDLARRMAATASAPALAMAGRSDLSARIASVLDARQPRGRAGCGRATLAATLALATVMAIAPLRAVREASAIAIGTETETEGRQRSGRISRIDRALVEAAEEGDAEDVVDLLNTGANVNASVDGDGSPLIAAARGGHLDIVTLLLDRGADVNLAVQGDGNPLIMAAREGHTPVVQLLLDRGASVDLIVPEDENALIQASGEGHLETVRLLVSRGADVNARVWVEPAYERPRGEWRTPLSMARRGSHRAVVEFLTAQGARQ